MATPGEQFKDVMERLVSEMMHLRRVMAGFSGGGTAQPQPQSQTQPQQPQQSVGGSGGQQSARQQASPAAPPFAPPDPTFPTPGPLSRPMSQEALAGLQGQYQKQADEQTADSYGATQRLLGAAGGMVPGAASLSIGMAKLRGLSEAWDHFKRTQWAQKQPKPQPPRMKMPPPPLPPGLPATHYPSSEKMPATTLHKPAPLPATTLHQPTTLHVPTTPHPTTPHPLTPQQTRTTLHQPLPGTALHRPPLPATTLHPPAPHVPPPSTRPAPRVRPPSAGPAPRTRRRPAGEDEGEFSLDFRKTMLRGQPLPPSPNQARRTLLAAGEESDSERDLAHGGGTLAGQNQLLEVLGKIKDSIDELLEETKEANKDESAAPTATGGKTQLGGATPAPSGGKQQQADFNPPTASSHGMNWADLLKQVIATAGS